MSNNLKIILSTFIMVIIISLLFLIVEITGTFIVSYIFTIIAIITIATSLMIFGKYETTKAPQGYSFIYTSVTYSIFNVIFSIIAIIINLSILWTIVIHTTMLGIFFIITIAISSGSNYISKTNKSAEEKHNDFVDEKKKYWN